MPCFMGMLRLAGASSMDEVGLRRGAARKLADFHEITAKLAAALNAHDLCEALLSIATPLVLLLIILHRVSSCG